MSGTDELEPINMHARGNEMYILVRKADLTYHITEFQGFFMNTGTASVAAGRIGTAPGGSNYERMDISYNHRAKRVFLHD
jgi:hypothetical protein